MTINWSDYKGQHNAVKYVRNCISKNIFPKSLLITGPPGVGKSLLAELTIRSIICSSNNINKHSNKHNSKPCGECDYCTTNVRELANVRWNQITNITGMTDYLTETGLWAREAPIYLDDIGITRKFVVLDEIQLLSTNYIQSLLGYIDCSPVTTTWLLISMDLSRLSSTDLEALSSRCTSLNLYPHNENDCIDYITSKWSLDYTSAKLLANIADGNMRQIGSLIDYCKGVDSDLTSIADVLVGGAKDRANFWSSLYNRDYNQSMSICGDWLKTTNSQVIAKLLINDVIDQLSIQPNDNLIHDLDLLVRYSTNTIKTGLAAYTCLLYGFKQVQILQDKDLSTFYSLKQLEDYYIEYCIY